MRPQVAIPAIILAFLLSLVVAIFWPQQRMRSRNLGCPEFPNPRAREICKALSDSMEWTWSGHGIIWPGWRVTWSALRRAFCAARIGAADLPALEILKSSPDWRLQDAADSLSRLVSSRSGNSIEPENSIFDPDNPGYILKDGCPGIPGF